MTSWVSGPVRAHKIAAAFTTLALAVAITAASLVLTHSLSQATSSASPYAIPDVVDTNPDPNIVETTLSAAPATGLDLSSDADLPELNSVNGQTINGSIPAPTFHLKVGDTVIVHYENHLDKPSAIHWHGVEVSNQMDGTPLVQNQVAPGGQFLYKFKVNRPGIFWYHPHHHSSTNQVFKGLYGMIIVKDPNEGALQASGVLPAQDQTFPLVLSDVTVCKATGNDTATYPGALPHVSGTPFPATTQNPPVPKDLCEAPTALNEEGDPGPAFGAGDIPNIQQKTPARTNEGRTVLTNGKNVGGRTATQAAPPGSALSALGAPAAGSSLLDVRPGQGVRLQILNASTIRYMRLRLTRATGAQENLFRVGGEGGLLNEAILEGGAGLEYNSGEILVPPGSRADVVAAIPVGAAASVMTLWTEDFTRLGGGGLGTFANTPTVPVMHLNVTGAALPQYAIAAGTDLRLATGDPVEQLGAATGDYLIPANFAPAKPGLNVAVTLNTQANTKASINNNQGSHDFPGDYKDATHGIINQSSAHYVKVGDTLELTVENQTQADHPFHLHGFSIQPRTISGNTTESFLGNPEFRDNVNIPNNSLLTFRVKLDPRPMPDGTTPGGEVGRWVFHCHIFFHAVLGMISELVVTNGAGNERPNIDAVSTSVAANQGATATVQGTFKDPDGDPVTLSASVGTVTANGTAGWTWTYPTGADSSRYVYITARDSNGLQSQVPFFLRVTNVGGPALTVPATKSVPSGDSLSFGISATDPDPPDKLTLSATGLPAGLAFKDNGDRTGAVSGKVTALAGDYTATYTADDGHGHKTTAQGKITVTPFAIVLSQPERLVRRAITVGCRFDTISLRTCAATVKSSGKTIGRGSTTLKKSGKRTANVSVLLSASARRKIARSVPGLAVSVGLTGTKFGASKRYAISGTTRVVAPTVVARASFDVFGARSATLTTRGKTYLASVAKQVGRAKRITCTGHRDGSSRTLAAARAKAACAALKAGGLRATFRSATSRTTSRRLEITILR